MTSNKLTFTAKELAEIFPEAIQIIELNLSEQLNLKDQLVKAIKKDLKTMENYPEMERFFCKEWITITLGKELIDLEKHIYRLKTLKNMMHGSSIQNQNNDELIHKARDAPITEVVGRYTELKPIGDKFCIRCPFHDDKRPSCVIYPKTNSFYCFGCQAGGDVISFTRKVHECSFREAVNILLNSY